MNSRDLLCAISEADEDYINESSQFETIAASFKTERKKKQKRITVTAVAFLCCLAAVGIFTQMPESVFVIQPAVVGNTEGTASSDNTAETEMTAPFSAVDALPSQAGNKADPFEENLTTTSENLTTTSADTVIKQEPAAPGKPEVITGDGSQKGTGTQSAGYYLRWNNKLSMTGTLKTAIDENPGCVFAVLGVFRPVTAEVTDFVYEGKTLSQIAIEFENERQKPEKMKELLKWGDALKYGKALYETGTPDGAKWSKALYDDKVAYFGEELLGKYIVDGEFLREALENDIAALPTIKVTAPDGTSTVIYAGDESAAKQYTLAYNAYLETVLPQTVSELSASGIRCERDAYMSNAFVLYATAGQLEDLPQQFSENWYFDLDSGDRKGPSADGTVTN